MVLELQHPSHSLKFRAHMPEDSPRPERACLLGNMKVEHCHPALCLGGSLQDSQEGEWLNAEEQKLMNPLSTLGL